MKKTNKTFKRFAAITSASLLAACAVMPAISTAADITINGWNTATANDDGTHIYEAYQIFDGSLSGTSPNFVLSSIQWGSGIDVWDEDGDLDTTKQNTIITAIKGITIGEAPNTTKPFDLNTVVDAETVADVLATVGNDHVLAKEFAKTIATFLKSDAKATSSNGTISNLDDGYYLVQDADGSPSNTTGEDNSGAKTRYILKVAGEDIEVQAKSSAPSVEKKVFENSYNKNDGYGTGYNDVADHEIGDAIGFKLIGTLPSTYDDYSTYFYQFTDTYATTLDTVDSNSDGVDVVVKYYKANEKIGEDVGTVISSDYYSVQEEEDNNSFNVTFTNLKEITALNSGCKIVVEYSAMLTDNAIIGRPGQRNDVMLTYSNNPNVTGEGSKGKTPKDEVIVYTYELNIDKTKSEITNETTLDEFNSAKLKGAEFILYKKDGSDLYAAVLDGNVIDGWVKGAFNATGTAFVKDSSTDYDATVLTSGNDTYQTIKVKGLDEGTYYIKEIKEPTGYNKLEGETELIINAETVNGQSWTGATETLTSLTLNEKDALNVDEALGRNGSADVENDGINTGLVWTGIVNKAGNTLPGTGGIGTTIFYLGGGAMAAIGGIYLISKRRMRKSEE